MFKRYEPILLLLMCAMMLAACADSKYAVIPHSHGSPESLSDDRRDCAHQVAVLHAKNHDSTGAVIGGVMFGALGGAIGGAMSNADDKTDYTAVMAKCMREKGYKLKGE